MAEVASHEAHTNAWYDFLVAGRPMDWRKLFADYDVRVPAIAARTEKAVGADPRVV